MLPTLLICEVVGWFMVEEIVKMQHSIEFIEESIL